MGRNMFGGSGPWEDDPWDGWWGDDPPFHTPSSSSPTTPASRLPKEGGTTFTFVTDGIESALEQARERPAVRTCPWAVARTSPSST